MNDRVFIDTNVLVYADDLDAGDKYLDAVDVLWFSIFHRPRDPQPCYHNVDETLSRSTISWQA